MSAPITRPPIACIDVALDIPLRQSFSYHFGEQLPAVGARVRVPFGRRTMVGVVVAHRQAEPKSIKLKSIISVVDETAIFSTTLLALIDWTAKYYHHPLGETWRTAMPVVLRKGLAITHGLTEQVYCLDSLPTQWRTQSKRAPVQQKVMHLFEMDTELTYQAILAQLPNARTALKALVNKGWLKQTEKIGQRVPVLPDEHNNSLTPDQLLVFEALALNFNRFQCSLLQGVTGSGKTEVYFSLIDKALAQNKQALVLLPEIALTDQHFSRFTDRFGSRVVQIHSGMNAAMRHRIGWWARTGEIDIVLATRSGVFIEFKALGLIIVDEEHDLSYKQQEGLRYHARSVAIKRAQLDDIPIVLGSATPALETLHNVDAGRYQKVTLNRRVGSSQLPDIELIDLNVHQADTGLSRVAIQAIERTLKHKQQVLVFINRRGYAPVLYCPACQWTAQCKRCDAQMTTHHKIHVLQCHHCGARRRIPHECDSCGEADLITLGEGTQKIEETLVGRFPNARIQRFDRDELSTASKLKQAMDEVHAEKIDILVGTQLLSKGHDFSAVDLVLVVNADQGLYSADFRAPEQLVQQMIQVAGRAGRGDKKGRVLIQSSFSTHPAMLAVQRHEYSAFAKQELAQRQCAQFPPYHHIALWRVRGREANQVLAFLQNVARIGRKVQPDESYCFDPVKSPMFKRGGQYHAQLLMSAGRRQVLHQWLEAWIPLIEQSKSKQQTKWSIDVDPMSLF